MLGVGCADSGTSENKDFLIRVQDSILTVSDFKKAFEIAKSAYSHNEMQNPATLKSARQRLLNHLTEELILIERAKELNIQVTDAEVEAAVREIKSDYPDDGDFEKVLLEHAVPYPVWKQRLQRRMLMEKIIEEELKLLMIIEPDEILSYHDEYIRPKSDSKSISADPNRVIVMQLRRRKAEDAYSDWIQNLEKRYSIEFNRTQWKKIADL